MEHGDGVWRQLRERNGVSVQREWCGACIQWILEEEVSSLSWLTANSPNNGQWIWPSCQKVFVIHIGPWKIRLNHVLNHVLCPSVADPGGVPRVPRNPPFKPDSLLRLGSRSAWLRFLAAREAQTLNVLRSSPFWLNGYYSKHCNPVSNSRLVRILNPPFQFSGSATTPDNFRR